MSPIPYSLVDFDQLPATPCPCGTARRGLMEDASVPYSIHITDISRNARVHYHKRLTETYFFLECAAGSAMELDGEVVPVVARQAIVVRPGTRHRAIGEMKVMLIVTPKFDAADEWFD